MEVEEVEAKGVVEGPKKKTEWVQCEDCDKWRKCPPDIVHTVISTLIPLLRRGRQALTCVAFVVCVASSCRSSGTVT